MRSGRIVLSLAQWRLRADSFPSGLNDASTFRTELDIWRYVARENVELASIYYAHERPVYRRDGMWMTPGVWGGPAEGEELETRWVRYRTVGDGSTTGAVLSEARTNEEILAEVAASRLTERGATRGDDRVSEAAMEDRKREGYF